MTPWAQIIAAALLLMAMRRACASADAVTPPATVEHVPPQPKSGQPVTVTALLGRTAGNPTLMIQVVEPGNYIRKTDAKYTNAWRALPMRDDGTGGDAVKGDGIFTVMVPAEYQKHRRIVRYRVSFTAASGITVHIPAPAADCPNFGYFVYDGMPAWTAASQPGKTPSLTFPAEFMRTLPAWHVVARREDVEQSQWDGGANKKRFFATLFANGRLYDHVQFHNRGKASTYVSGKNKWGFKFNESQPFHDVDLWARPQTNLWKSVSLTACSSPWAQVNRGMAGMDEAVSFRAYQLSGVPSSSTHWLQLRVMAQADEAPTNQYGGDVWGLYQVVQEPGGEWLNERGLPDGEVYSPETGVKHRPRGAPTNDVAFQRFMSGPHGGNAEMWWRTNFNLPAYYTFHALNRVLSNIDVRPGANYYLYRAPDGRWTVIPWDLDMMFIPKTHQPGYVDQARCLDVPALRLEYQNRAREILDLFCSDPAPDGGQVGQLVAELARVLTPAAFGRAWPEFDLCAWNWHPRSNAKGQFYVTPFGDGRMGGGWTRTLSTPDFAGFCKYIVEFCTDSRPVKNYAINDGDQRGYGFGYLSIEAHDEAAPARPVIRLAGEEKRRVPVVTRAGRASTNAAPAALVFEVSPFQPAPTSTNSHFAAMQWRLGEITAPGVPRFPAGQPQKYEIEELWRSDEMAVATNRFHLALDSCRVGHTYRVRARCKDTTGHWSHWSDAVQFRAR